MKKFEKMRSKILMGLAAVCAMSAPAVSHADDCCWDCDCNSACDLEWYVGVDYLYWKPCHNNLEYAAVTEQQGEIISEQLDYSIKHVCPE